MTEFSLKSLAALTALLAAASVAACSNLPQDDRYQSPGRGGGWENFRAEAPVLAPAVVKAT